MVGEEVPEDVGFELGEGAGLRGVLQGSGHEREPVLDPARQFRGQVRRQPGHAVLGGGDLHLSVRLGSNPAGSDRFGVQLFPN